MLGGVDATQSAGMSSLVSSIIEYAGFPSCRHRASSIHAGHLYASNDYEKATELARELILDEKKRKAMAAAGRAHVEKLGWMAAVKRIRDTQYQRAINTFRAHKRSVLLGLLSVVSSMYLPACSAYPDGPHKTVHKAVDFSIGLACTEVEEQVLSQGSPREADCKGRNSL